MNDFWHPEHTSVFDKVYNMDFAQLSAVDLIEHHTEKGVYVTQASLEAEIAAHWEKMKKIIADAQPLRNVRIVINPPDWSKLPGFIKKP